MMIHMLHAFIDESGQRGGTARASDHFVMSAVVYRTVSGHRVGGLLENLRSVAGRGSGHELHFKKLRPHQRTAVSKLLGEQGWVRMISVVVCKRHLGDASLDDDQRYLFALRMILERLSWLAKDNDQVAEYTLAHIQRFKLSTLRSYEHALRSSSTQIRWRFLDPKGGKLNHPKTLEALQLADIAASSIGAAFNPSEATGETERSHLVALRPVMWVRGSSALTSYGLKMHPWRESTKVAYPWVATL
jgi:hypothetical protein